MNDHKKSGIKTVRLGEAPWSCGEHWGLTVWAMVLGQEFNSWIRLKTRWIRWTTWWQKITKIIKTAKKGKSHQKIFFLKDSEVFILIVRFHDIKDWNLLTSNGVWIQVDTLFKIVKRTQFVHSKMIGY